MTNEYTEPFRTQRKSANLYGGNDRLADEGRYAAPKWRDQLPGDMYGHSR
jgi:hypothetical protein